MRLVVENQLGSSSSWGHSLMASFALSLALGLVACNGCQPAGPGDPVCTDSRDCPIEQTCVQGQCLSLDGGGDGGSNWWEDGGTNDGGADAGLDAGSDAGSDAGPVDAGPPEICDNGLDDNLDGQVDEGCACTDAAIQSCWPGRSGRRGVGACRDGAQLCHTYGDILAWGPCEGAVLPTTEIPGNGTDEDCDGADGVVACSGTVEICGNNLDDECDGLTDCDDPDCRSSCSNCAATETACVDTIDDDCDGLTDCTDPDCALALLCLSGGGTCTPTFPYVSEIACKDQIDNDCDGNTDCGDSNCRAPGFCGCSQTETSCGDNEDNDCDGFTDCADGDCEGCVPGTLRWCDEPTACNWGTQNCGPDGHWEGCYESTNAPNGCDPTGFYSKDCCVTAGECCQNYPADQSSVGQCTNIVSAGCP